MTSPKAFEMDRRDEAQWLLREVCGAHIRGAIELPEETYELCMHHLYGPDWHDIDWPRYVWISRGKILKGPTNCMSDLLETPDVELQDKPLLIVSVNNKLETYRRHRRWHKGKQEWISRTR